MREWAESGSVANYALLDDAVRVNHVIVTDSRVNDHATDVDEVAAADDGTSPQTRAGFNDSIRADCDSIVDACTRAYRDAFQRVTPRNPCIQRRLSFDQLRPIINAHQ